jgi:hypothetical protein
MKMLPNKVNKFLITKEIKYHDEIEKYYIIDEDYRVTIMSENELVGLLINELRKHKLTINNEYVAIEYRSVVKNGTMISNLYNSGSLLENLAEALEDVLE